MGSAGAPVEMHPSMMVSADVKAKLDAGRRATAGWLRQLADQIETLPLEDAAELLTWVGHALEQLRVEAERILKRE